MQQIQNSMHEPKEPVRQASHLKVVWILLSGAIESSVSDAGRFLGAKPQNYTLVCVFDSLTNENAC